jgi:3-oxoacyl-[acyl-carrier-protein] synthase-1
MRAGIDAFAELPYLDNHGEPIMGAVVPELAPELRGRARLVELLKRPLAGLPDRLPESLPLDQLPLLVCTREPERPGATVNAIVREVETTLGIAFRRDNSDHVPRGSVGAFEALAHARRIITEGRAEACLIAAFDTLVDARALLWLDRAKRLKTPMQSDGVIPGEGACVTLVTAAPATPTHVAIRGLGFAVEAATVLNEESFLGKGMAAAVRGALGEAGLAMHEIDFRLSDVAGESYAFEELSLAHSRVQRTVRECQVLWHPADKTGDCGAAAGLLQLAWAEQALARGYAPGRLGMCHGSAATGARAAAVVGN